VSSSNRSDAIAIPRRAVRGTVWAIVFVIGLVILAFLVLQIVRSIAPADPLAAGINSNEYQAVFLTNGQVYFGKMTAPGGGFYYIRNVYYLTSPPGSKGNQTLAKLTNDVHGPEDLVIVNRNQIIYVENLNPKGRAAQIIARGGP
jgi:hypothetical protein